MTERVQVYCGESSFRSRRLFCCFQFRIYEIQIPTFPPPLYRIFVYLIFLSLGADDKERGRKIGSRHCYQRSFLLGGGGGGFLGEKGTWRWGESLRHDLDFMGGAARLGAFGGRFATRYVVVDVLVIPLFEEKEIYVMRFYLHYQASVLTDLFLVLRVFSV